MTDVEIIKPGGNSHLQASISDRGFSHHPVVAAECGAKVYVREASTATGPHMWLEVADGDTEAVAHLTAAQAWRVGEQIFHGLLEHYQGDDDPAWADLRNAVSDMASALRAGRAAADRLGEESDDWLSV